MFLKNKIVLVFHLQVTKLSIYITDFKEKAKIFSAFFSEQCSLINNSSKLPSTFLKRTEKVMSSILFSGNCIAKIIGELDLKDSWS